MGLDWQTLTYGTYVAALAEWNARHGDGKPKLEADPQDIDDLRRAMAAHRK
jgi:hypothetical protein